MTDVRAEILAASRSRAGWRENSPVHTDRRHVIDSIKSNFEEKVMEKSEKRMSGSTTKLDLGRRRGTKVSSIANMFQSLTPTRETSPVKPTASMRPPSPRGNSLPSTPSGGSSLTRTESHVTRFNNARAMFERLEEQTKKTILIVSPGGTKRLHSKSPSSSCSSQCSSPVNSYPTTTSCSTSPLRFRGSVTPPRDSEHDTFLTSSSPSDMCLVLEKKECEGAQESTHNLSCNTAVATSPTPDSVSMPVIVDQKFPLNEQDKPVDSSNVRTSLLQEDSKSEFESESSSRNSVIIVENDVNCNHKNVLAFEEKLLTKLPVSSASATSSNSEVLNTYVKTFHDVQKDRALNEGSSEAVKDCQSVNSKPGNLENVPQSANTQSRTSFSSENVPVQKSASAEQLSGNADFPSKHSSKTVQRQSFDGLQQHVPPVENNTSAHISKAAKEDHTTTTVPNQVEKEAQNAAGAYSRDEEYAKQVSEESYDHFNHAESNAMGDGTIETSVDDVVSDTIKRRSQDLRDLIGYSSDDSSSRRESLLSDMSMPDSCLPWPGESLSDMTDFLQQMQSDFFCQDHRTSSDSAPFSPEEFNNRGYPSEHSQHMVNSESMHEEVELMTQEEAHKLLSRKSWEEILRDHHAEEVTKILREQLAATIQGFQEKQQEYDGKADDTTKLDANNISEEKKDDDYDEEESSAGEAGVEMDLLPGATIVYEDKEYHILPNGHFFTEQGGLSADSDEDEVTVYCPVPPRKKTRVKFSTQPIKVFSTHSVEDYDRRNDEVDPVAASAEYELEKRIEKMDVFPVELMKGPEGLGLSIIGMGVGADAGLEKLGIFVKTITEGGAAQRDGRIWVNDQIIEVDGKSLVGVTQAYAASVLRNTSGLVRFLIGREKDGANSEIAQLISQSLQADRERDAAVRALEQKKQQTSGLGHFPHDRRDSDPAVSPSCFLSGDAQSTETSSSQQSSPDTEGAPFIGLDMANDSSDSLSPDIDTELFRAKLREAQCKHALVKAELKKVKEKYEIERRDYQRRIEDLQVQLQQAECALQTSQRETSQYQHMLADAKNQYLTLERKYTKAKKLIKDLQQREEDFVQKEEYHLQQQQEKDQEYNALVRTLKDRIIMLERKLFEIQRAGGMGLQGTGDGSMQQLIPPIGTKIQGSPLNKPVAVVRQLQLNVSDDDSSDNEGGKSNISSPDDERVIAKKQEDTDKEDGGGKTVKVKEDFDKAVPQTELLDTSAAKAKAELASKGSLANRQPPTLKKQSSSGSSDSMYSSEKEKSDNVADADLGDGEVFRPSSGEMDSIPSVGSLSPSGTLEEKPVVEGGEETSNENKREENQYWGEPASPISSSDNKHAEELTRGHFSATTSIAKHVTPPTSKTTDLSPQSQEDKLPKVSVEHVNDNERRSFSADSSEQNQYVNLPFHTSNVQTFSTFKPPPSQVQHDISAPKIIETNISKAPPVTGSATTIMKVSSHTRTMQTFGSGQTTRSSINSHSMVTTTTPRAPVIPPPTPDSKMGKKGTPSETSGSSGTLETDVTPSSGANSPSRISGGGDSADNTPQKEKKRFPEPERRPYHWRGRPVYEWTTSQVSQWLVALGLEQHIPRFTERGVTGHHLLQLDSTQLKSLGIVNSSDRSLIKKKIKEMKGQIEKERKAHEREQKAREKLQKKAEKAAEKTLKKK